MTPFELLVRRSWSHSVWPLRSTPMRVSLVFVAQRINVWLRFGKPAQETVLDRRRRVATFEPGAVCCRVRWIGNGYGTALWELIVLHAPHPYDGIQRITGVVPGACLLLRADGERQVKAVLEVIDAIEAAGIDPCDVAFAYWRTVGNRLAARQSLPEYTIERHAAHLARRVLR